MVAAKMEMHSIPVHFIVAHSLVELFDIFGELLGFLHQEVNIDLVPQRGVPVSECEHDGTHHVPQCLEVTQLLLQYGSLVSAF